MLTTRQMQPVVGMSGVLRFEKLDVGVTILDVRQVWGRVDVLVEPCAGSGQQWVSSDRVTLEAECQSEVLAP
jgi:hypothetical protein